MLKVLIVDDNLLIRKSLIKRIRWEQLDMRCVGEAENGQEASHMIGQLSPDIVITDVKMPKADGFSAIRETQNRHPGLQFIVISGYDDFSYLKQSVQLGVLNYILKPIDTEELHETLQLAASKVREYVCARQIRQTAKDYEALYSREKLERVLVQFLFSHIDFETLSDCLAALACPFVFPYAQVLVWNFPAEESREEPLSPAGIRGVEEAIERLCFPAKCVTLRVFRRTCVSIINQPEAASLSPHLLSALYEAVKTLTVQPCGMYLSCGVPSQVKNLLTVYHQAISRMLGRFWVQGGNTILASGQSGKIDRDLSAFENELTIALQLQSCDSAMRIIRKTLKSAPVGSESFSEALSKLMEAVNAYAVQHQGQPLCAPSSLELYLLTFPSLEHLLSALEDSLKKMEQSREEEDIGDQAVRYLREHFTKPLTVQSLSKLFHVNQNYLGQLIRKKTGQSFNDLINSMRVRLAEETIRSNPAVSLKELAVSLGFVDAHYFTKVFKRYSGMSPSEFRAQAENPPEAE